MTTTTLTPADRFNIPLEDPALTLDVLRGARRLLSDPIKLTRGYYARTREGEEVSCYDPRAYAYDVLGAINLAYHVRHQPRFWSLSYAVVELGCTVDRPRHLVGAWGDHADWSDIVTALDKTIQRLATPIDSNPPTE